MLYQKTRFLKINLNQIQKKLRVIFIKLQLIQMRIIIL